MKCPICKKEANEKELYLITEGFTEEEIAMLENALNRRISKKIVVACTACNRNFDPCSWQVHHTQNK